MIARESQWSDNNIVDSFSSVCLLACLLLLLINVLHWIKQQQRRFQAISYDSHPVYHTLIALYSQIGSIRYYLGVWALSNEHCYMHYVYHTLSRYVTPAIQIHMKSTHTQTLVTVDTHERNHCFIKCTAHTRPIRMETCSTLATPHHSILQPNHENWTFFRFSIACLFCLAHSHSTQSSLTQTTHQSL